MDWGKLSGKIEDYEAGKSSIEEFSSYLDEVFLKGVWTFTLWTRSGFPMSVPVHIMFLRRGNRYTIPFPIETKVILRASPYTFTVVKGEYELKGFAGEGKDLDIIPNIFVEDTTFVLERLSFTLHHRRSA